MEKRNRIVLVTGSRALATHSIAQEHLGETLDALQYEYLVTIVTGDAIGPDRWALAYANEHALQYMEFRKTGELNWCDKSIKPWYDPQNEAQMAALRDPKRAPLARNAAMVARVIEAQKKAYDVCVVAQIAGWSTTNGTRNTITLAQRGGISRDNIHDRTYSLDELSNCA